MSDPLKKLMYDYGLSCLIYGFAAGFVVGYIIKGVFG